MDKLEVRDMSQSNAFLSQLRQAEWTQWTIDKTTRDGIKASGWVYLAIKMISDAVATVPVVVYNPNGKIEWNHPITKLFENPHPDFSRSDIMRLIAAWTQLSGCAYLRKVKGTKTTRELWPVSPDRIAPIASPDNGFLLSGYEIQTNGSRKQDSGYTRESVIRVCLADPSNPLMGISPLMSASRAIDVDVSMQSWNKSLMQNRGSPDYHISIDADNVTDQQKDSILRSIMKRISGAANARIPLITTSKTTITRLGLTQQEMDFLESRKWNRDEILAIFGVPSQLAGSTESATFNNFAESKRIFWINTILPLLDHIIESFNSSLRSELTDGYYIGTDLSKIDALSDSQDAKLDRSKKLFDMGVPVKIISERFDLGISEFKDWDKPFSGTKATADSSLASNVRLSSNASNASDLEKRGAVNWTLLPTELRKVDAEEARREEFASKTMAPLFEKMLEEQRDFVFGMVDDNESFEDIEEELVSISDNHIKAIRKATTDAAVGAGDDIVVAKMEQRSELSVEFRDDSNLAKRVAMYLAAEAVVETEISFFNSYTGEILGSIVSDSRANNETIQQLKDRMTRGGYFEPQRALRVARTLTGAASSVGQVAAATEVGAEFKTWSSSGGARDGHSARNGEKVRMDARFSNHYGGSPRWPLDSSTTSKDRVNCRCSMHFSFDSE